MALVEEREREKDEWRGRGRGEEGGYLWWIERVVTRE